MALDPLTAGVELAQTVITRIWPDKSAAEAAQLAAQVAIVQGQLDTNRAEASSPSADISASVISSGCLQFWQSLRTRR